MQSDSTYVVKIRRDQFKLWQDGRPLLAHLDLELTERCNNNCIHCYINLPAGDANAKERELTTDQIKEILREAVSLGCLRVRFTGGEPLLREDFEELYLFARRLGIKVLIFTNGTLITPHLTRLFARVPPLEKIEVSIYGIRRESYEGVTRVPGSFEAALRGVNLLLEGKIPFILKSALLPPNRGETQEFEEWACMIPWMDRSPSYSMFFDLRARRDSQEKNSSIKKLRVSPEQGLDVLKRRRKEYLNEMREFCSKFTGPPGEYVFSCGAGVRSGCVDAYGNLQPCMMIRHPAITYDLRKGSMTGAIRKFFPKVRQMKSENPDYLNRCAKCFLNGLCHQCPAKSWIEHGTLDSPVEYFCKVAHIQAEYLGLIATGERAWQISDWKDRLRSLSGETVQLVGLGNRSA